MSGWGHRAIGALLAVGAIASIAYIVLGGDADAPPAAARRAPASATTEATTAAPPALPPPQVVTATPRDDPPAPPAASAANGCAPGGELVDEQMDEQTRGRGCVSRVDGQRQREGTWTLSTTQGFAMSGEFEHGQRQGKWTAWYPSGAVFQYVYFVDGKKNGTWVQWTEDGKKAFERDYRDDRQDGPEVVYLPDGGIERATWRDGVRID